MVTRTVDDLRAPPPLTCSGQVLDFDWVTELCFGLNKLTMTIMAFPENGQYDMLTDDYDDDAASSQHSDLPWGSAREATYWGGHGRPPAHLCAAVPDEPARENHGKGCGDYVKRYLTQQFE